MLLRMKTTMAGPEITVQAGEIFDCPDGKLARQLVDDGHADEYTADDGAVEMVSTFHGGLKAVSREIHELKTDIPAPPDSSTTREEAEVVFPIERRTADELARDAQAAANGGPAAKADQAPVKSSDQQAAEEIASKVAIAQVPPADAEGLASRGITGRSTSSRPSPGLKSQPTQSKSAPAVSDKATATETKEVK